MNSLARISTSFNLLFLPMYSFAELVRKTTCLAAKKNKQWLNDCSIPYHSTNYFKILQDSDALLLVPRLGD